MRSSVSWPLSGLTVLSKAGCDIGSGVVLGPGCVIGQGAKLGEDSRLTANVTVCHGVHIGKRCVVKEWHCIGQ
ncbi:MAG: hypothetical protein Ct9H300mP14_07720 [Gammaproteobacteria bacterium]|nr:MAG: hypothetical protein Ct9H300mP14_07720 [Gammaproteobacteria bacterium]